MAFDGVTWNEARPDNNDLANEIDDYMRDSNIGVRSRMEHEHTWPSSQSSTAQGGFHKFITFNGQTSAPVLVYATNTQLASIWCSSGSKNVMISDSAGSSYVLMKSAVGLVFFAGTGAIGDLPYVTSGGGFVQLAAGSSGYVLTAAGTTAAPTWTAISGIAGTWSSGAAVGSATQVTKDSFVISKFETAETTPTSATFKTDSSNPPTTERGKVELDANDHPSAQTISCFVKKNEYYLINTSGGVITVTTYIIPIGA